VMGLWTPDSNIPWIFATLRGIHKFGDTADFALGIDAGEDAGCLGDDFAGSWVRLWRAGELVRVLNFAGGDGGAGGFESKLLIIKGGSAIPDIQFGDDEEDACGLEVFICQAICPQKFGAAHLEIDGIYAVVHDPALVGLVVAGLNGYRATL